MAWGVLPKPGDRLGPCEGACLHVDCVATRTDAAALCCECKQPIGYETAYYRIGSELVHEACVDGMKLEGVG